MGKEGEFDFAKIADSIGSLKKGTPEPEVQTVNNRKVDPPKDNKDEIIIRRKKDKEIESSEEADKLTLDSNIDIKSNDEDDIEDKKDEVEDVDFKDDTQETQENESDDLGDKDIGEGSPDDSINFKKLRQNRNELAKKSRQLAKEKEDLENKINELKGLEKYKNLFEFSVSPEFYEAFGGAREKIVGQAKELGEAYGYPGDQLAKVFEAETIRDAKEILDEVVDDSQASSELNTFIRDFYVNKNKEEKALQDEDPKATYQKFREERENRLAKEKELKLEQTTIAKNRTKSEMEGIFSDPEDSKRMWNGIYNEDLSEYITTDLAPIHKERSLNNYEKLFNHFHKKGADLSISDSKTLAVLTADAAMGSVANKVIPILLNKLKKYEKELSIQTKNRNPEIRQTNSKDRNPNDNKTLTKEDKALAAVRSALGKS